MDEAMEIDPSGLPVCSVGLGLRANPTNYPDVFEVNAREYRDTSQAIPYDVKTVVAIFHK